MSTTVDQRVVEMRFDNKHFESNVATTMSTLDKLKRALHLDGASKGLENINSAANKVNMSGLAGGVEEVRAKFSALEVIGVTALANITNSAVNAGKQWVKSLSVDQIAAGWSKYGDKTASVQTIMNATGKSIDEVNQYLNKLMWFSDETSYGFTDMTAALGQMTSAGGDIDKLIPLITGVANATAFAGKGASEFSRVMYNLNQSYSKGYLDYADWKSIDLAGVSSKQLKQMIIDVGIAQGKIKEGEITLGNFAATLKDKWADTSVLEEAFGNFAEMSDLAYEMVQAGEVDTASEAYEILSQKYDNVAITAAKAAQEAKTFSEAIDATKDAVSSGWMKSFEIIFGDYQEAKVLWTDLANTLWDVFAAGSEVRNWVLETALNFAEPWRAIEEKLGNVNKAIDKVKNSTKTLEHFQKVVSKVWRGDFNNRGDNPDRYDLLRKAGYDPRVVQDLVNKGYQYKLTVEDIEASHKKFGLSLVTSTEEAAELTKKLEELDEETLKNLGLTEDEIELYKALAKEAERTGKSIDEIADSMSKNNGRTMLIDSFKNFGSVILDTIQIMKDGLAEVFDVPTAADMVIKLHNMIMALHDFSESIRLTNKETGELTETGEKFLSIFKGIFAAIDIVLTILKGPAKLAFNILKELLNLFGVNVLDILADVGEGIVGFRDTVDKVVDTITKFIVDHVAKWIEKFKETEFFKSTANMFVDASDKISGAVGNISNKFANFSDSGIGKTLKTISDFISKIAKSVGNSKIVTFVIDGIRSAFESLKSFFTGFKLPEFNIDNLKMFFTNFSNLGKNIQASGKGGIAGVVDGIAKTLGGHTSLIKAKSNFQTGIESFFTGFVNFWLKIGDGLKKAFTICQDAVKGIVKFIFGTEEVNLPTIMDAVEKFLWILTLLKTIQLLDTFVSPFENITSALDNVANSLKWKAIGDAFKSMALALGVLTVCIVILCSIDDMGKAWQAAGMLAGLLIIMGGVIAGLGFLSSKIGGLDVKGMFGISMSLLILIGAIALMVKTLKDLDGLKLNDPLKTFGYLAATLLALSIGVSLVSKAGTANFASIAGLLTLVGALKLILDVITAYDEYDWFGKTKAIEKMMQMLVALSVAVNIATRGVKAGSNVKGLAFMLLAMVFSLKILLSAIEEFAAMEDDVLLKGGAVVTVLLGLMTGMMAVANLTSKGTVLEKGQKNVNSFTGFAVALLAVVTAIWLLGRMDIKTLEQGGWAVAQILGLMTGMLAVLGKSCSGLKTGTIIAMIIGFGVLMAEMALLVKWLDDVSWESKVSSLVAIGGMLLAMASVLHILSKDDVKTKDIYKWLGALAVLGLIAGELALVLYAIKDMNPLTAIGNAVALSALLLTMAGVLHILSSLDMRKLSTKKMTKLALIFAGMGLILAELAGVLYLIRDINGGNSVGNAIALSTLLVAMSGVLHVLSALDMRKLSASKMTKLLLMFAGLGLILYELSGVLAILGRIDPLRAIPNTLALVALFGALSSVLVIFSELKVKFNGGAIAAMALLGLVLAELVGILILAEQIDPVSALPRVLVLSSLLGVLAGVLLVLDKFKVGFNGGAVAGIALLGLVLAELIGILILAEQIDPASALPRMVPLAALLGVLAVVATALDKLNVKFSGGAVATIALLGAVLGELAGVLILANNIKAEGAITRVLALSSLLSVLAIVATTLDKFKVKLNAGSVAAMALLGLVLAELAGIMIIANGIDAEGAIARVTALSMLVSVLTLLLIPLSLIGGLVASAFAGIGALAVLMTSLLIVVGVLYLMDGLQNAVENAKTLTVMTTVLTLLLIPLTLIGALVVPALAGVGALAVLMTSLLIVVGVLALMEGIENAQANTNILITLLNTLTTTLVTVSLLGPLAAIGVTCFGALIGMLRVMTVFVIALGAIMEYCPMIEDFVNNGLGLLIKLAGGIGEMISAFAVGLTSGLPEIGQNLTDFANNLKGFLTIINNDISDDTVTKAGKLALVVAALTGVGIADGFNIVDGLKKLFGGESSLEALGTKLSTFGNNIKDFVAAINNFDADSATNMDALAGAIESLNAVCGNNNFGDGQLENIGKQTAGFASSMKSVAESLKDLTDDDVANIRRAADGAKEIARLNDSIPKTGGTWQDIAGSADLASWGLSIEAFADSLVAYSSKVSGKTIDAEAIKASAAAAQSLADVTNSLGKVGGLWQSITGQTDLVGFGDAIVPFADSLIAYNNKIAGASIDVEAIKNSASAATALTDVVNALPEEDGFWQKIAGQKDLIGFGTGLTALGQGLVDYAATAATIDETKIEAIKTSGTAVDEIITVVNKIPKTGGTAGWFGEHDPYAFGSGVSALANGIKQICNVAATITQEDIDAIGFSKSAVEKIVELVNTIPEEFSSESSTSFKTAIVAIHDVCKNINAISTAGYDYSGIDTVKSAISKLKDIITADAANSLKTNVDTVKTAVKNVSTVASTIATLNNKNYGGVKILNNALDELSEAKVQAVIDTFEGKAESFKSAITGIVNALKDGLNSDVSKTSITKVMTSLLDSGLNALKNKDKLAAAKTAGTNLAKNAASGTGDETAVSNAKTAGKNLVKGFAAGITENTYIAEAKAKAMANAAEKAAKEALDINSPSKVFRAIGYSVPEGFAQGIDRMGSLVTSSSTDMAQAAILNVKSSIARIADTVNSDIDTQPTIRPVLDLSDVESGAATIGSMLGLNSSVGVRANVGAISASMANRQNGADNSEIVSGIKALRKDIANMPREQYNINGITYSGDSEVNDAIKTLVRYANIERRT